RAHLDCDIADDREVIRGRIEIEDQLVRVFILVDALQSYVWGEASLIRNVNQGLGVVANHVCDGPAVFRHHDAGDPVREVRVHILLKDRGSIDIRLKALHGETALANVRNDEGRDAAVILDHISLGDAVTGEYHTILA